MNNVIDVDFFDQLVIEFYEKKENQKKLNDILTKFSEHPNAWMQSSEIIIKSSNVGSKLIALRILQVCIQKRWKLLPKIEKIGIRNFLEQIMIEMCKKISLGKEELKPLLTKINTTLIEVVKHEWP